MQSASLNSTELEAAQILGSLQFKTIDLGNKGFTSENKSGKQKLSRKSRSRDYDKKCSKNRSKSESNSHELTLHELTKKLSQASDNSSSENDSEEEIELIRRRRNRFDLKVGKPEKLYQGEDQIDFSDNLHCMLKYIHEGKKLKLDQHSTLMLNQYLNDMAKNIMTNSKDLLSKLSKQLKCKRRTLTGWDIKSSVELLFGYGSTKANQINLYACRKLLQRSHSMRTSKTYEEKKTVSKAKNQ